MGLGGADSAKGSHPNPLTRIQDSLTQPEFQGSEQGSSDITELLNSQSQTAMSAVLRYVRSVEVLGTSQSQQLLSEVLSGYSF